MADEKKTPPTPAPRKPYTAPDVTAFGSIADLTQTGGNTKTDAKGTKQRVN